MSKEESDKHSPSEIDGCEEIEAAEVERPLHSEALLMEYVTQLRGSSGLVISPGRAQTAVLLAEQMQFSTVHAWYLDLHDATVASSRLEDLAADSPESSGPLVEVLCGSDLPGSDAEQLEAYDLVALITLKRSESELTRDLLQQAHQRLHNGGYLIASVDNPKDTWLHDQLRNMFDKVTCKRQSEGCVYWARKTKPLKKVRDFSCEFDFKDGEHILYAISRPGVFSHRRLDPAARQLMLCSEIDESDNVLDMGCGSGALTMAVAKRTQGQVFGVDSNARAIDCLTRGIQRNGIENIVPIWNADGELALPVSIDVALANPPYFGEDRISQLFTDAAISVMRIGAALLVVSKQPNWYEAYFEQLALEDIVTFEAGHYFVTCGRKT